MINKPYENISIELHENYNLKELQEYLKEKGETKIRLIIPEKNKKIIFNLENSRKFDLNVFNDVKSKEYVKKITF